MGILSAAKAGAKALEEAFKAEQAASKAALHVADRPSASKSVIAKKQKAVPPPLERARPKTKEEINAIAERIAPQFTGEFVRGKKGTTSVAGKSRKQWDMEQEYEHDIRDIKDLPPVTPVDLARHKGSVQLSLPGDYTISDKDIYSIAGRQLREPSRQYGGPRFGLGQDDAGWASGFAPAAGFQRRAIEASRQYGDVPVLGNYMMMGPEGMNYALHFSDALLKSIDPTRMTADQIDTINQAIRFGTPKKHFYDFVGIEHPEEAYMQMAEDPKLRKHFNALMQQPTMTEALDLPSGMAARHAVTEPALRDLERGMTGHSIIELDPSQTALRPSEHPTYKYDIPGKFLGEAEVMSPYELTFPDVVQSIRANPKQAKSEFGTLQMGGGKQIIDQQLIDEIEQYRRRIKQLTGKKKGGLAGGGPAERRDVSELTPIARNRAGQPVSGGMIPGAVEGLFNTLAGAAKGATQATLGFPGDINELLLEVGSAFPNAPKPYTSKEIGKMLPSAGKSQEAGIGEAAGEFLPLPAIPVGKIAKSVKSGAQAIAPRAGDLASQFINKQAEAMGLPLEMGVVKPKGGNWLAGSIERVTEPMKTPKIAGQTPQERVIEHEKLLANPSLNADQLDRVNYHLEVTKGEAALDKWIDKKLNSYIKNEMGTPEDQIRLGIERRYEDAKKLRSANQTKLDKMAADIDRNQAAGKDTTLTERDYEAAKERFAEDEDIAFQGLYHGTVPEGGWMGGNVWEPRSLLSKRERGGFPEYGMGNHPAAKQWEAVSDAEINSTPAGQFVGDGMPESHYDITNTLASTHKQRVLDQNPWLSKVDPEAKVYNLDYMNPDVGLEFRHMIDEVKTAMDPDSNLPKHLKIAAKDLEKMTVDDVSALSGKISAWRNAQIGKPNLELANNPAVSLYKEYPTANNPKGVSWRQIKRPEGLPDEEADKALRDAIVYEGDIMRHCVGGSGHCEPLLRGDTEVYSLRDAKGEPHVTIEVEPAKNPYPINASLFNDGTTRRDSATRAQYRQYVMEWRQRNPDVEKLTDENVYQALREAGVRPVSPSIVEIKGKNNRKPKDEYIPFIQDFIKSGDWSNVGDMHHTDLRKSEDIFSQLEKKTLQNEGYQIGNYLSSKEIENLQNAFKQIEVDKDVARKKEMSKPFTDAQITGDWEPEGMKRGGAVRMAEGGQAPSNWTDYLSQHAQEESMRLMGGDTALNPMKDGGSINLDDMIRKAVEKANSRNYASGGASLKNIESKEGLAPYGLRHSGEGAKGKGYFGGMPGKHGMVTELSTESEGIGEHPLIVPTLTREELEYLLAGGDPTEPIYKKARQHAEGRKSKGKGSFADPSELRYPKPEYADGGVVNIDDLIQKAITLRNQHA
jgi:hypothetical protein